MFLSSPSFLPMHRTARSLSPWEKDKGPYGPSLLPELNIWSIMDINWKNTLCSSEQVHWMFQVRCRSLASALFTVRRCWYTFSSCVPQCSPSGKHFSLLYLYPPYQRPHHVLRLSHQYPLALAKTAVQGLWRNKLSKAPVFNSCPTTSLQSASPTITHSSGHFQGVLTALGSVLSYTPLSSPLFFGTFFSFSPFPYLSSTVLSKFSLSVIHPLFFLWFYKQEKY